MFLITCLLGDLALSFTWSVKSVCTACWSVVWLGLELVLSACLLLASCLLAACMQFVCCLLGYFRLLDLQESVCVHTSYGMLNDRFEF